MPRLLKLLDNHLLEIGIGFLLFFIPLYPKLPLFDIRHTWVYVRLEDFLVAFLVGVWLIQLARKKVSLKTPLTFPILVYWLAGGLSLLFAIFILASHLANFYPHLALLHYFRRIEYMILFFIAACVVKDLRSVKKYILVIAFTLFAVCLYGFGQKYLGFPAFLTMNEEFSKGIPLYLSPEARITSTFAGHYDLSAYLVFMIVFFGSLIFAFPKAFLKAALFLLVFLSFIVLLLTASRISFMVYLVGITIMLWLQRKRWLIVPVIIVSVLVMNYVSGTSQRFGKTFRVKRVVYEAKTGQPLAVLEEIGDVGKLITEEEEIAKESLPAGSGFFPVPVVIQPPPEATQVAVIRKPVISSLKTATKASEIATISGEFLIKRAVVYDISFTTRFQGEWPRAIEAFRRNMLFGSGFSSISLATDNDYLRLLGETGLLGFFTFLSIFFVFSLIIRQTLRKIVKPLPRGILIGVFAGMVTLMFNAVLIDVFEASKVAYVFWLVLGLSVGLIQILVPRRGSLLKEAVAVAKSPWPTIVGLLGLALLIFPPFFKNYFVGDDFTWLKWALSSRIGDLSQYFFSAHGFFYRPLAKIYFFLAAPIFNLNPYGYHIFSLALHYGSAVAAYFLTLLLSKKKAVSSLVALLFLIHPVNGESVFWIASTSHLLGSFFYLWGMVAYIKWRATENNWRWLFLILVILAFVLGLASHERMITFPLMIIACDLIFYRLKLVYHLPFWVIVGEYLWLRNYGAQAHSLTGDYSYNLKNLPFNLIGNLLGYLGELIMGLRFIPLYDVFRNYLRSHKEIALVIIVVIGLLTGRILTKLKIKKWWESKNLNLIVFALLWFFILLLPFLGLGNIAERYVYGAHLGFFILVALLLDWFYRWLSKKKSIKVALLAIIILVLGIVTFYVKDTQKVRNDWYQAGETVNKTLLSLATNYSDFEVGTNLYFVNLPIRYRRSWIFPVGLEDAIWLIYRDETLKIYKENDLEEALDLAKKTSKAYVFIFEDDVLKEAKE